jgi:hypothetical protein
MCSSLGSKRVRTTTPEGKSGPMTNPRNPMRTTDDVGELSKANSTSNPTAHKKYKTVARLTPIRSVPKPSTSRPMAIPTQYTDDARLARYGVAPRLRSMNETTQPEMAVSVPT